MHEGVESVRLGLRGIPRASEDVMERGMCCWPSSPACAITLPISLRRTRSPWWPRQTKGLPVTAEATPHHFALADADMLPYDSNYKMKPPLRAHCDVDAVVKD